MKTLRVFAWLLLSVCLLLVGTVGYLPFYLQAHQADLEAVAGEALGRPVAIDGVALGWLLHPRPGLSIVLKGLRVSNPDWDTDQTLGPHLLEAERVDVTWQLSALLHRQVRIDQLVIRGARVMLQKTADGRDNWQLGKDKDKGSSKISLRIPTVQLSDSQITFASPKAPVRRAHITRLQLDGLGAEPLLLQAELSINDTPLTLSARAGAADAPSGARWPFQVQAQSADTRVELNGSAPAPFATTGLDAKLQVQGPTVVPLGQIAGINGLPAGPFRFETGLSWDGQTLKASAINGSSEADVLPAPLSVSDGEISVPLHGPWSVRMTGKLGDRPATLQLTPVAVPKTSGQTAGTQTADVQATGALAIKATLAEGRFDGELRPASGDARALLSGKLHAGTVTLADGVQDKVSKPDAQETSGPAATNTKAKAKVAKAPAWPDRPLPFSSLTRLDADLDLAVEALTWQRITMRGLQARGQAPRRPPAARRGQAGAARIDRQRPGARRRRRQGSRAQTQAEHGPHRLGAGPVDAGPGPGGGRQHRRFESGRRGQRRDSGDTDPHPERHPAGQIGPAAAARQAGPKGHGHRSRQPYPARRRRPGGELQDRLGEGQSGPGWAVHGRDADRRDAGRPAARGAVLAADRRRCPDPHRPASAEHPRSPGAARGHPHRPRPDARL